jgi:hypothetical protein
MVRQSGGAVTVAAVVEELKGVKVGVDRTAAELAIVRLKEEIAALYMLRDKAFDGTDSKKVGDNSSNSFYSGLVAFVFTVIFIISLPGGTSKGGWGVVANIFLLVMAVLLWTITVQLAKYQTRLVVELGENQLRNIQPYELMIEAKKTELKKYHDVVMIE